MRILLAEDEKDMNRILTERLKKEGYTVDSVTDGDAARYLLLAIDYDAAVLDVMMPLSDGFSVLRDIRRRGIRTPVLFLTARDSVEDRVHGLDSGADDYLVKPFALEEFLARVRVLLRGEGGREDGLLRVGDLTLDTVRKQASRAGQEIPLTAREYALLEYLMRNRGLILSRAQIEDHVWSMDYEGGTNVVDVYIGYLRRKVDDGHDVKLIRTIRGRGYSLRTPEAEEGPES